MKELNTVDLFCGAGGASTGLELALHKDIHPLIKKSLKRRKTTCPDVEFPFLAFFDLQRFFIVI